MKKLKRYLAGLCLLALTLSVWTSEQYTYRVLADDQTEEEVWIQEAKTQLQKILQERTILALVYLSDMFSVREEPDGDSGVVVQVPSGQQVQIRGVEVTQDYEVWEYVTFYYQGQEYRGYVPRANLACSDEVFLAWEEYYGMNPASRGLFTTEGEQTSIYEDVEQFPESYQGALRALKDAHPNWTFVKMNTGLDWNEVVENEMVRGRNLIPSSFPEYMWDGIHSPNWAYVTRDSLSYYLDPRNGLTEEYIFQFELLTYNESYHTLEAVQLFLDNTFMSGLIPDLEITYALTFWAVGKEQNISPFHLACRVYQEQGDGTSPLISGDYDGYEGFYNYFNIGASGQTREEVIVSGLERAKKENWYNGYYSILGGAKILAANYILHGQDTLYLQKFDVDGSYDGMYWHQYMQNVCAPFSEGKNIRKSYVNAGSLDNTFVFKIPVYDNMPESACEKPTVSYTVSLTAPEGYTDPTVYVDGVEYTAELYDDRYFVEVSGGDAATAVMYQYNEKNVPVGMHVWELSHDGKVYQVQEVSELSDLLSYHGFSIRITGKSGIRFKTGISAAVREQLLGESGLAGYQLKEYGTLVMNNANREMYPLILGGEKVLSGRSYGLDENGVLEDKIYETVNDRYRFTSVLVGLPVSQYKTEFAFRGYAVLMKGEEEVILYGPTVWRSIYTLAQQVLDTGQYAEGSDAYLFLNQMISDADSLETQETQETQ